MKRIAGDLWIGVIIPALSYLAIALAILVALYVGSRLLGVEVGELRSLLPSQ